MAGLTPATTFLIRMQAINEIERSPFTDSIVLKTQEEAPTEAPSNVQVQTGGESELIVTWQVSDNIHVAWFLITLIRELNTDMLNVVIDAFKGKKS